MTRKHRSQKTRRSKKEPKGNKFKGTAGSIKEELAKKWRKSGSLGKNEKLSTENASKTMKAAKEVMKKNGRLPKSGVIKKTQEKLEKNSKVNEKKHKKQTVDKMVKDAVKSWREQGKFKGAPSKEAVENAKEIGEKVYEKAEKHKVPVDIEKEDLKEGFNKEVKKKFK